MSARDEILKKIDSAVKRKKELSTQLSRDKTLLFWVCSFFEEMEKLGRFDIDGSLIFTATCNLRDKIRGIDKNAFVYYKPGTQDEEPRVIIVWSNSYVAVHGCDTSTTFEMSTALIQRLLEQ